jgi:hypothetical protein
LRNIGDYEGRTKLWLQKNKGETGLTNGQKLKCEPDTLQPEKSEKEWKTVGEKSLQEISVMRKRGEKMEIGNIIIRAQEVS